MLLRFSKGRLVLSQEGAHKVAHRLMTVFFEALLGVMMRCAVLHSAVSSNADLRTSSLNWENGKIESQLKTIDDWGQVLLHLFLVVPNRYLGVHCALAFQHSTLALKRGR